MQRRNPDSDAAAVILLWVGEKGGSKTLSTNEVKDSELETG